MPALSKPRLMIAAAFVAGVATTAAFVAIGSGDTTSPEVKPGTKLPTTALDSRAESGFGSWVDPSQPTASQHTSHVGPSNLVFQPDAQAEEDGGSRDQVEKSAAELKVPVPPRRPEDFRVIANSDNQEANADVTDRRVRKVVVPNRADSTARNQKPAQASVQRHAETKEDAVRIKVREPRQRVTSTQPNGVMQWLIEPSRF